MTDSNVIKGNFRHISEPVMAVMDDLAAKRRQKFEDEENHQFWEERIIEGLDVLTKADQLPRIDRIQTVINIYYAGAKHERSTETNR